MTTNEDPPTNRALSTASSEACHETPRDIEILAERYKDADVRLVLFGAEAGNEMVAVYASQWFVTAMPAHRKADIERAFERARRKDADA